MKRERPSREQIEELYEYNPTTGIFLWKVDNPSKLARKGMRAGKVDPDGYRSLSFRGNRQQASWVAWFLHTGKWPEEEMDHINHNRDDDRIYNLREANRSQNCGHKRFLRGNKLGYRGIKIQTSGRFHAAICVEYKEYALGTYDTAIEAALAYDNAAKEHFGEYALLNFPKDR